jgi:adenylylsulfate kinase
MKILICGLPGSGKSTLAKPFADLIGGVWLNGNAIRNQHDDWDFSIKGRLRQALRMGHIAEGIVMAGKIAVADFTCPTQVARDWFSPDYTVWMDTIKESRFEDTNKMFERPAQCDYHVAKWFNDTHTQLMPVVQRWKEKNNV